MGRYEDVERLESFPVLDEALRVVQTHPGPGPGLGLAFRDAMREIKERAGGDAEWFHGDADDLLCFVLRRLGFGEGVDLFESHTKWYA